MTTDDRDTALLERLGAGEATALEHLMDRFAGRLYRVARSITADEQDAEEVVQDVFVALLRKGASFEGRAALGTWLYRIAVNLALNKRRGMRAEVEVALDDYLPRYRDDGHRDGDRSFLLADWSPPPDAVLLSTEGGRRSVGPWTGCRHPTARSFYSATSRNCPTRTLPRYSASPWRRSSRDSIGREWSCGNSSRTSTSAPTLPATRPRWRRRH